MRVPGRCQRGLIRTDMFAGVPFPCPSFAGHPSSSPFLGTFLPLSPPRKVLCSAEQGTAQSLERGSFRMDLSTKFGKEILPEICMKKRPEKQIGDGSEVYLAQRKGNLKDAIVQIWNL